MKASARSVSTNKDKPCSTNGKRKENSAEFIGEGQGLVRLGLKPEFIGRLKDSLRVAKSSLYS
jgi:ATP-dependent protease Clp ATPase subunit